MVSEHRTRRPVLRVPLVALIACTLLAAAPTASVATPPGKNGQIAFRRYLDATEIHGGALQGGPRRQRRGPDHPPTAWGRGPVRGLGARRAQTRVRAQGALPCRRGEGRPGQRLRPGLHGAERRDRFEGTRSVRVRRRQAVPRHLRRRTHSCVVAQRLDGRLSLRPRRRALRRQLQHEYRHLGRGRRRLWTPSGHTAVAGELVGPRAAVVAGREKARLRSRRPRSEVRGRLHGELRRDRPLPGDSVDAARRGAARLVAGRQVGSSPPPGRRTDPRTSTRSTRTARGSST